MVCLPGVFTALFKSNYHVNFADPIIEEHLSFSSGDGEITLPASMQLARKTFYSEFVSVNKYVRAIVTCCVQGVERRVMHFSFTKQSF